MLLGHLVGDYLLQNEWMALNKTKYSWIGWLSAFIHCILYTLSVCLFTWKFKLIWIIAIFISHFPIDKFGLAELYMHYIKGKGMKDYVHKYDWVNKLKYTTKPEIPPVDRYVALEGGFTALVYAITDNSMHLVLMYLAYKIIF
jgi:hypothetical protein